LLQRKKAEMFMYVIKQHVTQTYGRRRNEASCSLTLTLDRGEWSTLLSSHCICERETPYPLWASAKVSYDGKERKEFYWCRLPAGDRKECSQYSMDCFV